MTTGTKTAATSSTSFWIGAFDPCASSTMLSPCAPAWSRRRPPSPRTRTTPFWLIVPPMTRSPARFSTGIDSPVIIDSSIVLCAFAHDAVDRRPSRRAGR